MSWIYLIKPNLVLKNSIVSLPPEALVAQGLRGLILDVDHTLVPSHTRAVSQELQQWIAEVRSLMPLWLVTNNLNQARIQQIADQLDLPYLLGAGKPSRRKLREAAHAMGIPAKEMGMVGDRLFTDILAGNRLGMFTILVDPIAEAGARGRYNIVHWFEFALSRLLGVPVI